MSFEVSQPIQNPPYDEPSKYWFIREGESPELKDGRRPAMVFQPRDQQDAWDDDGIIRKLTEYERGYELVLVNIIRESVRKWRAEDYPGVTRTTYDLLQHWRSADRRAGLFFAQLEAAETVIFMKEARSDFLQGIDVPREEVSEDARANGITGFERLACKMATGSGKSTVMAMLASWSILNKVNDRADGRFSDVVLIVTPNITIRDRLRELDPLAGDASLYRTRDLVPLHLMPLLARGRVLVTNWHVLATQAPNGGGVSSRVVRAGVPVTRTEKITVGERTTTARGSRYMTLEAFEAHVASGGVEVVSEPERHPDGSLKSVKIRSTEYVESDTAFVKRVLGRAVGGKQNILVMNDEAHHAYRIRREDPDEEEQDLFGEGDDDEFFKEATVWIEGLDKIHKLRGINFCVDLSATPYFLGRVGQLTARPFPWVVSEFGLIDAIESGLVKIPQLALRDTTGYDRARYFNLWRFITEQLTSAERGTKKGSPKPEAILKHADVPLALMAGSYKETSDAWSAAGIERPPVFILVCKNTKIAAAAYEWLANGHAPPGVPQSSLDHFRNRDGAANTIRVDTKVVDEITLDGAKGDEVRWMRFTLDTIGKREWPRDSQGRSLYPDGFEALAHMLERPLEPPGRDVRCIVSVGMLTEGWDANTVTHIVGLRPFMSQLLCEQVVGRGLRRMSYEPGEDGLLPEEVAQVLGVPFEVIPFKATAGAPAPQPTRRTHVHALPDRKQFEIRFPRVEWYRQVIQRKLAVDWSAVAPLVLDPMRIPPSFVLGHYVPDSKGAPSTFGVGRVREVTLRQYRLSRRLQSRMFELARDLTRSYLSPDPSKAPAHELFPQMYRIVEQFVRERVDAQGEFEVDDVFLAPFYSEMRARILDGIRPEVEEGEPVELPRYVAGREEGSTADVDFWTSKAPYAIQRSHVNFAVPDSRWEQATAQRLDSHRVVSAFVKNAGLGFAIPYQIQGESHDFIPDFIVRLTTDPAVHLVLETKGYDPFAEVKEAAAQRWVKAVNADGAFGRWSFCMARNPNDVPQILAAAELGDLS
jgi:type III restriction enzyme